MKSLSANEIAWAAQIASILEVNAWKPGNVTRLQDYPDCRFEDFLVSAVAIGPAFREAAHSSVGTTILRAVKDTRRLVGTNTNLGVVLLLAPLAKAAATGNAAGLRAAVVEVIEALTVEDARYAYEAICLARPAGLGKVEHYDVHGAEVDVTLREAMESARDRDTIAKEYVTGFELTFELGYVTLHKLHRQGCRLSDSILQTFLTILAQVPDSLIVRKNGPAVAMHVSKQARQVLDRGGVFSESGTEELQRLDRVLRDREHRLNPGTTADLVAAALFVLLTDGGALDGLKHMIRNW